MQATHVCVCVRVLPGSSLSLLCSVNQQAAAVTSEQTALLSAAAGWKEGETGERNREGKREQDSSCQASVAHLSHRKSAPATVSWIHLLKHCSCKEWREDICSMRGRDGRRDTLTDQ